MGTSDFNTYEIFVRKRSYLIYFVLLTIPLGIFAVCPNNKLHLSIRYFASKVVICLNFNPTCSCSNRIKFIFYSALTQLALKSVT